MPCPADPTLGKQCMQTRKRSVYIYIISVFIFIFATIFICSTEDNIKMDHPSHKDKLPSIKRIEGQVKGIAKMIEEERYCIEILNQIKAIKNSISTVERKILQTHLRGLRERFSSW